VRKRWGLIFFLIEKDTFDLIGTFVKNIHFIRVGLALSYLMVGVGVLVVGKFMVS
jgi:hypothetical protein